MGYEDYGWVAEGDEPAERILRRLRGMTGESQEEFAARLGMPVSTLRNWEQGRTDPPRWLLPLLWRDATDYADSLGCNDWRD